MSAARFTIVTGTRQREDLQRFCKSLANVKIPFRLIVSDASEEKYAESILSGLQLGQIQEIILIKEETRLGFSAGYNLAISEVGTEWVVWLNDDCEILPGWDMALLAFMDLESNHNKIGTIFFSDPGKSFRVYSHAKFLYANFGVIRKDLWNKIGGFCTRIFTYGADTELCMRAYAQYGIITVPVYGCRVNHYRSAWTENVSCRKDGEAVFTEEYEKLRFSLGEVSTWPPFISDTECRMIRFSTPTRGRQFDPVPFSIRRIFWIYNVGPDIVRANHRHESCEQVLIAVKGSFEVVTKGSSGDGLFKLNNKSTGLYIPVQHLIQMKNFSADAICLVLASEPYDPNESRPDNGI